jgi:hypothetical protein
MGKHTKYWEEYDRERIRRGPRIFASFLIMSVVFSGAAALGVPYWLVMTMLAISAFAFAGRVYGADYYDVICPECATHYDRPVWGGGQCPTCGLLFLHPGGKTAPDAGPRDA